jgi:hypothetical protein
MLYLSMLYARTACRVKAATITLNRVSKPKYMTTAFRVVAVASLAKRSGLRVIYLFHIPVLLESVCVHEPIGFQILTIEFTTGTTASRRTGPCPRYGKFRLVQQVIVRSVWATTVVPTFAKADEAVVWAVDGSKSHHITLLCDPRFRAFVFAWYHQRPAASVVFRGHRVTQRGLVLSLDVANGGLQFRTWRDDLLIVGQLSAFTFHGEELDGVGLVRGEGAKFVADGKSHQLGGRQVRDLVGVAVREGARDGGSRGAHGNFA